MNRVVVDGRISKDKKMFHQHLKEVFSFPEYYGCNLDALYDCLLEITKETEIVLTYFDILEENLGQYAVSLFHTFKDAAEENDWIKILLQ